jgi:hypothetical protein
LRRPVWLVSMDSDQFNAPPTTTAALTACFTAYGATSDKTRIELVHFQCSDDIAPWLAQWQTTGLPTARDALGEGLQPVLGLGVYTWNAPRVSALAAMARCWRYCIPAGSATSCRWPTGAAGPEAPCSGQAPRMRRRLQKSRMSR